MNTQRNLGTLIGGALLIGLGLLTLFGQIFKGFHFWSLAWPLVIIGCGGLFFFGMLAGGKSLAGLAIPGSLITISGLTLLYQNLSGHWYSWSYGWTLTLASVGLGIFIMGVYQGNETRRQVGIKIMKIAAVLFIIFGTFFELILSPFGLTAGSYGFPILLILMGSYLVLTRSGLLEKKPAASEAAPEVSA